VPTRTLALVGLLVVEGILAVPIAFALGLYGLYFMASGGAALVTGLLGVTGIDVLNTSVRPVYALLLGPALAAIGAVILAALMGYFWVIARTARALRG
jgi:hypothetical protein